VVDQSHWKSPGVRTGCSSEMGVVFSGFYVIESIFRVICVSLFRFKFLI
jgi:hypothetical protein